MELAHTLNDNLVIMST